ncbi:MAG: GNAT family N-acetyltransferase [Rhodomicrobiaceae bacterium]
MVLAEFDAFHRPALERDEIRYNVLLSVMSRAASEDPPDQTRRWSFGVPGACVLQSPRRGLLLGNLSRDQCRQLAEETAGTRFKSVLGADDAPHWFVDRAREMGEQFGEPMPQRIHTLSGPPVYPGAPGVARPVTADDADLFAIWGAAFFAEAAPEDEPLTREQLDWNAASGLLLFWTVDGQPVSMAGIVRRLRNVCAIAWVYTPPELRGRGYAGSATAAVVEKIHAEGRSSACLYTDLRNPASNRCYEKIGFKPYCESWFVPQKAPPAS